MVTYIVVNIVNVILQTVRSLATVKCGKGLASLANALAYGFYVFVIVLTAIDGISIIMKCLIVGLTNLVGVFAVKLVEEKLRKDRLWKIEITCKARNTERLHNALTRKEIPHNFIENIGSYSIFNIYAQTQAESLLIKEIIDKYDCKYFITESKVF